MRFRYMFLLLGSIAIISIWIALDPTIGMGKLIALGYRTSSGIDTILKSFLYIALLHLSRKALLDYINISGFFHKAIQTSEGAGRAIIGVGLIMISIALVICASAVS